MRLYRLSRLLEIIQPASIFLKTFMPYLVFSQGHRNRWQPDNQWMHSLVGLWLSPLVSHYLFFVSSLYTQPDGWAENHHTASQPQRTGSKLSQFNRVGLVCLLVVEVILNTHPLLVLYIPNHPNGSQYSVQPPVNDYHRAGSIFRFN